MTGVIFWDLTTNRLVGQFGAASWHPPGFKQGGEAERE